MLGEAAVGLLDLDRDEVGGGFWTPSTALGDRLVERLEAHAGIRFDVLDFGLVPPAQVCGNQRGSRRPGAGNRDVN